MKAKNIKINYSSYHRSYGKSDNGNGYILAKPYKDGYIIDISQIKRALSKISWMGYNRKIILDLDSVGAPVYYDICGWIRELDLREREDRTYTHC